MDRYWGELENVASRQPPAGARVICALPRSAPAVSRRARRLLRAMHKYLVYPLRARLLAADLAHVLDHSYAHLLDFLPRGMRKVVTVFDLVPLRDPSGMTPGQIRRFSRTIRSIQRADVAICASRETAQDLHRLAGVSETCIEIVHPGIDLEKFGTPAGEFPGMRLLPQEARILLSVGSDEPRKNLKILPEILAPLRDRFRSGRWCLVRAGAHLRDPLRSDLLSILGPSGFMEFGPTFGRALLGLYQRASVFLMPSTLEGFSFTMMEAMAAGVPVLTQRSSTNPEVGLDAVPYFDPGDCAAATDLLDRLMTDEPWRQEWARRGRARVEGLTWETHWDRLRSIYGRLLRA